ncbi:MAG: 3-dehydroquinate synthase [Candidatus Ratteibacteria bacterium]
MEILTVSLSNVIYPIYLDYPLKKIGNLFHKHQCGKKILVITDENVARLYADVVVKSVSSMKNVHLSVVKPGESSKTIKVAYQLIKECSLFGMDRTDTIIALGGGVISDLAGFVSAIYLRGIRLISIPTTLLAQVDASVGGKTGINLPWGKNLVGAFHQPFFVVMDFSTLESLPAREISQGMAEIIKCAVIRSKKLFDLLQDVPGEDIKKYFKFLVRECISIKKRVVESDEKEEKGIREILNFGHTIGHAIEINSKLLNHGESVALGMLGETFLAVKRNFCSYSLFENLRALVKKYGLPVKCDVSVKRVSHSLTFDKKMKGGKIRCVMPLRIGAVKTGVEISPEEVISNWEQWQ